MTFPAVSGTEDLLRATRASFARLEAGLDALEVFGDDAMQVRTGSGWTVAATLAHLAFYDDWVAARWRRRLVEGRFQDLPDDITDLANAAGERGWHVVPGPLAMKIALEAATALAGLLEELPLAALEDAVGTDRPAMIDRSVHWDPHLEEIQRALA